MSTKREPPPDLNTLPDRRRFLLTADQWEAFQAALAAAPRPVPRLAKLLKEPSVFERDGGLDVIPERSGRGRCRFAGPQ
jgi:hypothetical protein